MTKLKRIMAVLLLAALALDGAALAESAGADTEAITQAAQSVLLLKVFDQNDRLIRQGCGFVFYNDFTLATTYGMVKGADWMLAVSGSGKNYIVSKVVAADEKKDIALLEFFSPTDIKHLTSSLGDEPKAGAAVVAVGAPGGDGQAIVPGSVTGLETLDDMPLISFEAPGFVGVPGGALFDVKGRLIGMTTGAPEGEKGALRAAGIRGLFLLMYANLKTERKTLPAYFGKKDTDIAPFPILKLASDPDALILQTPAPAPERKMEAPRRVKAQWAEGGALVTWDPVDDATGYKVMRSSLRDSGYVTLGTVETAEYLDEKAGQDYWYYRVRALKDSKQSDQSATADLIPQYALSETLKAPKGLKAKATAQSITVTFGAVKGADKYLVLRATSKDGTYRDLGTVNEARFEDLNAFSGQAYYYKVCAIKDGEISPLSISVSAKKPAPTPTPNLPKRPSPRPPPIWSRITLCRWGRAPNGRSTRTSGA